MNTVGTSLAGTLARAPYNPAYMNPEELTALGARPGDRVEIASSHGSVQAFVQPDKALRRGVVAIAHCWGGLPGDPGPGVNINALISCDSDVQPINAMPRMSAVPVNVRKIGGGSVASEAAV
jgi:anaerobic selenocysteine-containing dehydrogenase